VAHGSPVDPDGVSPSELQERIRAERGGDPHLLFRDDSYRQRILELGKAGPQLTIGRATACDICLEWDEGISRAHARLERLGQNAWMLVDDGLSRNGTIVNGERLRSRRRLRDGDVLRFGETHVLYRGPAKDTRKGPTVVAPATTIELSPAQRRVLVVLCKPYLEGGEFATPASNKLIADELVLSVDAVKTHLRSLFEKFQIEPLARDVKRTRLVQRALETGVVSHRDLEH
jgi:pSer/pThr/pTyr-binding forkhead associated (FHA) protein